MRNRRLCIFTYILAACVMFIMLRIEWLNAEAGGVLPNRTHYDNDPSQRVVKWRAMAMSVVESTWRQHNGIDDRPLIPTEQAQLDLEIRRQQANNSLRTFVGTIGLLQYLLAP